MRGKVFQYHDFSPVLGITPAYAGKSSINRTFGTLYRGSPPPMRGKAFRVREQRFHDGITPAYAGKSVGAFCVMPA